jgi:hypothetical protein
MDFGKARLPWIMISTLDRLPKLTGVLRVPVEELTIKVVEQANKRLTRYYR